MTVRLEDRLPYSGRQSDIRITLGELKDPLSENPLYLRLERSKGILRWDIKVPAQASAEKARMVDYDYNAEFDSSLTLSSPNQVQALRLQQDFYELENRRFRQ